VKMARCPVTTYCSKGHWQQLCPADFPQTRSSAAIKKHLGRQHICRGDRHSCLLISSEQ